MLTKEDHDAGVLLDAVVRLGETSKVDARPDHPIRLVVVKTTPHEKRGKAQGGSTGPASNGQLFIATNLLDLPAWIIGLIYRSEERLEPRRNRINPRVIKRKMSNWAKKRKNTVISRSQPWHSAPQSSWRIEGY